MTSLIDGRVRKDSLRVEAYGTVDECNAFVGQAIVVLKQYQGLFQDMIDDLLRIQHQLFDAGADLARKEQQDTPYRISEQQVTSLEQLIDRYDSESPALRQFVLPGGSDAAAILHICRVVARRAERRVVSLSLAEAMNEEVRRYLNRLSDLFFALARACNARLHINDVEYKPKSE